MTLIPTQRKNRLGTLGEQMATEIGLLREALADRAEAMADLDRLDAAAARFRSAVSNSPDEEQESDVRAWRHDLRNRLNHLTGPAQFLAMAFRGDARPPSLDRFLILCEECLASTVEDEPEVSGHLAEHPISKPVLPGKLLVADDDAENRSLLGRLLEGEGHSVEFAENGRTALEAIRNGDFDAVLLDIRMPEMDGFAVLEALRESGQLRHTP
ncbi:MAG: response regulator, partial [Verrucomicrobiae bacterium]|nr:response regulator [Verrucomicrobiae bacterium]